MAEGLTPKTSAAKVIVHIYVILVMVVNCDKYKVICTRYSEIDIRYNVATSGGNWHVIKMYAVGPLM